MLQRRERRYPTTFHAAVTAHSNIAAYHSTARHSQPEHVFNVRGLGDKLSHRGQQLRHHRRRQRVGNQRHLGRRRAAGPRGGACRCSASGCQEGALGGGRQGRRGKKGGKP